MKLTPITVSADGSTKFTSVERRTTSDAYLITFIFSGTISGTTNVQISPDGGTTKVNLRDTSGSVTNITAAGTLSFILPNSTKNSGAPELYITTSGSAGITMTVNAFDNRQDLSCFYKCMKCSMAMARQPILSSLASP